MTIFSTAQSSTIRTQTPRRILWIAMGLLALCLLLLWPSVAHADGIISVTGDTTADKCDTNTYTLSISNTDGVDWEYLTVKADISLLTGWSYVTGSTSMDIDGGGAFCSANPAQASGVLTWDIDSACSTNLVLHDGETLNISFQIAAGCDAISASLNPSVDFWVVGGGPGQDTTALSIQVNPGGVTIKQSPSVVSQVVGGQVSWTLEIENSGLGAISNVEITDVLGSGLSFDSATPAGDNAGQTTTWGPDEIPELASMDPGEIVTIDLNATVVGCENLDSVADVRWGCSLASACFDTSQDGGTATASVQRIPRTPLIEYYPSNVTFDYCVDYVDVAFPVQNTGDGTAHRIWLYVDLSELVVSDVSGGAVYNAVNKRFELPGELEGGSSFSLSFRLNHTAWCGTFPDGTLTWQTNYLDECDNAFYPPVHLSSVSAPSNRPSLSVTKEGADSIIQIGQSVTYHIQASYAGALSCGTGFASTIVVTDTLPDGFTVVDPGSGVYVPGAGGTGGTITWTADPVNGLDTMITLQAPSRDDCESYCNTTATNNLEATVVDCCGCPLSASASETSAIECDETVTATRWVTPGTSERCDVVTYYNEFQFQSNSLAVLNQLEFTEEAAHGQSLSILPGSLYVMLDGAPVPNVLTDQTPGGPLIISFAGTASTPLANHTLDIQYTMTIPESALGACSGSSFYDWASLSQGVSSGGECLMDGTIWQAAEVTIQPPAMSVAIEGLPTIMNQCDTQTVTLRLTQTSDVANPRDVRLMLSGANYYCSNPATTVCGGLAPLSCTPTVDGNGDYFWDFGDAFTGAGQEATLQLTLCKRCGTSSGLVATAYYDDLCNDDNVYDDTCSTMASAAPALLLGADLLIEKTPEVYYAVSKTVEFKIYVTNRGSGTAHNVWVDDVLGSGLDYSSATVDDMTGVTVTADQDHDGGAINGATIAIDDMTPGERREITFQAEIVSCDNLTNDVTASWGCVGQDCQTPVSDSATVEIPDPLLVTTNVVTSPVDACGDPQGSITLRNAGQTTCYDLQATVTLPANLLYVSGSTRWRLNSGAWTVQHVDYDPNPTASPLVWTSSEIPGLASINPGDTIEIEYDLSADCDFNGGTVTVATEYTNPCGRVFNVADSSFRVSLREPQVTITKTSSPSPVDCDDLVTWTITVHNTSGYTLPILWIEDTLPAAYTYDSSVGDGAYASDNGTNTGQVVTWELYDLSHNATAILTLRGVPSGTFCDSSMTNSVSAWWGCGTGDGSSATKPGVDAPDDSLCLYSTGVSDTDTPTRRPQAGLASISLSPTSIDACDDSTELTVVIENTGRTDASDIDLVVTLPDGISYNAGTSQMCLGPDDTCLASAVADPAVDGQVLTFRDLGDMGDNLVDTLQADGGNDTIVLKFSVQSLCYVTDDIQLRLYYYDCCGDTQYQDSDSVTLTALYPDLSVSISPRRSQVACGDSQTWDVTVTNNGDGNAQVVVVEVTPGAWIDLNLASSPGLIDMGGGTYGWEINNLAASGGSHTFTLVGTLNPDGYPNQNDCTNALRQLNVRTTWACGVAGDAIDNDPTTTDNYGCTHAPWASAPTGILRLPDLRINEINPTMVCDADGVFHGSVTVSVRNHGDGIAYGPFTVSASDGKGWSATGTYSGDVAAGATVEVSIDSIAWEPTCQPCADPYVFYATVDSGDAVCECGEGNNTYGPVDYVTPFPDLTITDIDFTPMTCQNDGFAGNVYVVVTNNGCATANNIWVQLTTDGCLSFSNRSFTTLAAGASETVVFPVTGAWSDCTAQTCLFTATVDPGSAICECDGNNNTRSEPFTNTLPDLIVSDITFDLGCNNDNAYGTVEVAVTNHGFSQPGSFEVALTTDGCYTFANQTSQGPLPGETVTVTFAVDGLWGDCTLADCEFTATVDATNTVCECDGTNNTRSESTSLSLPNLRTLSISPSTVCLSEGSYRTTVLVNVDNNGTADASNVVVRLGAACAPPGTFSDKNVNLAAGASDTLTFSWDHGPVPCNCLYTAQIDPDTAICECTGGDNISTLDHSTDMVDLQAVSNTAPLACVSDGVYSVTPQIMVANTGCGANYNGEIPVRLSVHAGLDCTGQLLDQWETTLSGVNIASGGGTQAFNLPARQITGNLAASVQDCATSIKVELDPENTICEIDDDNNTICGVQPPPSIPDLTVTGDTFEIVCNGVDGGLVATGAITVANQGCGAFTAPILEMHLQLFAGENCTGPILLDWQFAPLPGTIPAGVAVQIPLPPLPISTLLCQTACGPLSLQVELDPSNLVCETDGDNNVYCVPKSMDIPDLAVLSVTPSRKDAPDAVGTIVVRVANMGCGDVADATLRLTSDCGLTFLDKVVSLTAGEERDIVFGFPPPPCSPCQCTFMATFDPAQQICECDGSNNAGTSTTTTLEPELHVSKVAARNVVVVGETIGYTILVSNTGESNATGVMISDTLPAALEFLGPAVLVGSPTGSTAQDASDLPVMASDVTVVAGTTVTLTYQARVIDIGTIRNGVSVTSTQTPDPEEDEDPIDAAEMPTDVTGCPDTFCPSWTLGYSLRIHNTLPYPLTNLIVEDTLPAETCCPEQAPWSALDWTADPTERHLSWRVPSLGAGATIKLGFTAHSMSTLVSGDVVTNSFHYTADELTLSYTRTITLTVDSGRCGDPEPPPDPKMFDPTPTPKPTAACRITVPLVFKPN